MLSVSPFGIISKSCEYFHDSIPEIALDDNLAILCAASDAQFLLKLAPKLGKVVVSSDKALHQGDLLAGTLFAVDLHDEPLTRRVERFYLCIFLSFVFEIGVGGKYHAESVFPVVRGHMGYFFAKIKILFVYLWFDKGIFMDIKKFNLYNYITAAVVTLVSAVTYLLTMESSASFWDCGEFIASSYKFEVGHPPGNPVFQLFARIFTIPFSGENAAVAVNALSAICSAFTIFFLYLTIVFFAKRLISPKEGGCYSPAQAVAIIGSGVVGALVYTFSDTFWFSAVEGEVYAMSSLFTAIVFWAMTRWYEQADTPYANRWIVLISFLMGLSIGVHLLNLLTIPALVFMYYYKKREDGEYSFREFCGIFAVGVVILGLLNFIIIPYLPKVAAYVDLFFVNSLGLPFNAGAVFFMISLFALGFWGAFYTLKKGKVFANTAILCSIAILIGFSFFSICVIRSAAKTPTNEYQPDNPFTLVRYLSREQYGSAPLIYGQYFDSPAHIESTTYWAPMNGKYIKAQGQPNLVYDSAGKMFFPRMWSSSDDHIDFYEAYIADGRAVKGAQHKKPTFGDNMLFFIDYQMNFMYWRYFLWNFVGRQNEFHSNAPGDVFKGNWESGIKFIDDLFLGDQSLAPDFMAKNPGKNHYFFLPLLLGLIGLCFQFGRDKRGCWLTFLVFFMTGIAIVLFLNQPPYQVRERDYAYAGSFYAFSIWTGFAVMAFYAMVEKLLKNEKARTTATCGVAVLCLGVPALMGQQNWDDHNRHGRRTAVEIAYNYLNSVGPNGILITHGDNDTFPVWYAQEVEGIRTDVRVCNTSLLGTDWHIDQMKYACNESAPLPLSVPLKQYLYGTNEFVYIVDSRESVIPLSDVMRVFKHPEAKVTLSSGAKVDYIISRKISMPVNKENVLKYGILSAEFADRIPDEIVFTISPKKDYLTKQELFMLDLLDGYEWDRPINLLGMGGDLNMGIKEYLMFDGFSYRFVPIKTGCKRADAGVVDADRLYHLMTDVYRFDAAADTHHLVDYQNLYTFCGVMNYRDLFCQLARILNKRGRHADAEATLDRCMEVMNTKNYPLDMSVLSLGNELAVANMIDQYYFAGAPEKARALAVAFTDKLMESLVFYSSLYYNAKHEFETVATYLYYVCDDILTKHDDTELAAEILDKVNALVGED